MTPLIFIAGGHPPDAAHWHSLWAAQLPGVVRLQPDDGLPPRRAHWVDTLTTAIHAQEQPVVLVGHGLGCIAITHLPAAVAQRVHGALLVAPCDPARRGVLVDFTPVPYQPLPYRSILVASSNDPFCPVRTAGAYARSWGCEFVRLQKAGHINAAAGFGPWPLGLALLQSLQAQNTPPPQPHHPTLQPSPQQALA